MNKLWAGLMPKKQVESNMDVENPEVDIYLPWVEK